MYDFNLSSANNGSVKKITDNTATGPNLNYTYDTLNRIASAYSDATSGLKCSGETYTIDAWSNLTGITQKSGYGGSGCINETLSQSVSNANKITNTNFAYDAAGNLTNDGGSHSYTYDAENRVSQVGSSLNYYYDGDGQRVRKSSGTMYWYGADSSPLLETDGSGNLTYEYVFFNGQRIARRDSSSNVLYYFADHLGSARAIINSAGTSGESCYYYPYGAEMGSTCFTSSGNTYKFTGKERDGETGLDNFGARYFSSQYGRFMIPDWAPVPTPIPYADISSPQSLNLYAYVRNNPLSYRDIDGHRQECDRDTYSTGPNGELVVHGGECHEVADPQEASQQSAADPVWSKARGESWWKMFASEFFKLSGGPGNVPTCAEQALTQIAGEFVPISPGGASVIQATAPAAQAVAINQSIAQTQAGIDAYVAARGLTVPLRSSVVRAMAAQGTEGAVAAGARVNLAVQTLAVDFAAIKSTVVTAGQARSGGCAAALPIF